MFSKIKTIVFFISIYCTLNACTNQKEVSMSDLPKTDSKTSWKTGIITTSTFVNKIGEEMPQYQEHYFLCSEGEFFIKKQVCTYTNDIKSLENRYVKINASIQNGLWDTNDSNVQSRVGPYIVIDSIILIDTPEKIVYNDGNANAYIINTNNFKYDPVTTMESSSGTYSGGEPKNFEISNSQFNEIFIRAEQVVTNDNIKIDTRQMGTGFIKITFENSEIKAYIDNCPELKEFQNHLNEIK